MNVEEYVLVNIFQMQHIGSAPAWDFIIHASLIYTLTVNLRFTKCFRNSLRFAYSFAQHFELNKKEKYDRKLNPSLYLSHNHHINQVISFRLVRRHVTISQNSYIDVVKTVS